MMIVIKLILQVSGLYLLYIAGNWIQRTLELPIPGSILGMMILFILLVSRILNIKWIEFGSVFLLKWLPLLFLPSVVGIIAFGSFFIHKGKWLILLVVFNTIIVMAVGSLVSQWLANRDARNTKEGSSA